MTSRCCFLAEVPISNWLLSFGRGWVRDRAEAVAEDVVGCLKRSLQASISNDARVTVRDRCHSKLVSVAQRGSGNGGAYRALLLQRFFDSVSYHEIGGALHTAITDPTCETCTGNELYYFKAQRIQLGSDRKAPVRAWPVALHSARDNGSLA
jgi:hypothetical protein